MERAWWDQFLIYSHLISSHYFLGKGMNPFSFSDGLNKRVNWAQISEIKYCFNKEFFWLVPTKMSFILFRKTSSILFQENYAKFQSDNDIFIFCNDVVPFRFNINISYLGLRYFADILFQENIFYLVKTIFFFTFI